jgi:hypothetical protein
MRRVVLLLLLLFGCGASRAREVSPIADDVTRSPPPEASLRILDRDSIEFLPPPQINTRLTIETNSESGEWRVVRENTSQSSRSMQTTRAAQIVFEAENGEAFVSAIDCGDPRGAARGGRLFVFDQDLNVRRLLSIAPHYFVGTERTATSLKAIALPRADDPCGHPTDGKLQKPMLVEIDHLERLLFDYRLRKQDKPIFVE